MTPVDFGNVPFNYGGYVTPFDLAILFLLVGGTLMAFTWKENTDTSSSDALAEACAKLGVALKLLRSDPLLLLLMVISSVFEAAMHASSSEGGAGCCAAAAAGVRTAPAATATRLGSCTAEG